MDLNLAGKLALITGGSKGIGKGIGEALAREGCNLHLVARDPDQLAKTAEAISNTFDVSVAVTAMDMSASGAAEALISAMPRVDILINNAGAVPAGDIARIDEATWREAWDLKIYGYINLTRLMLPRMIEGGGGVICNITGLAGDRPNKDFVAGAAGNASLNAFSCAIGGRSIDDGVRVFAVSPGAVMTERMVGLFKARAETEGIDPNNWQSLMAAMPMGRAAKVEEVGDVVAFLVSDRAAYVSGTVVNIDGGARFRG